MDEIHISKFFSKKLNLIKEKGDIFNNILNLLNEEFNQNISVDNLKIKNNLIMLKGSVIFKNEVFIKKEKILNKINKKNNYLFKDIVFFN